MALAAARQGKYDAFHHAMFSADSLGPAAIAAAAAKAAVGTDGSADATATVAVFQAELDHHLSIASQRSEVRGVGKGGDGRRRYRGSRQNNTRKHLTQET